MNSYGSSCESMKSFTRKPALYSLVSSEDFSPSFLYQLYPYLMSLAAPAKGPLCVLLEPGKIVIYHHCLWLSVYIKPQSIASSLVGFVSKKYPFDPLGLLSKRRNGR
jgi:hypothetical protein